MPDLLAETVISALADVKHVAPERISLDSSFAELGVDSLDAITLLFELETRLEIVIPDEAAKSARGVRDVVEGLRALAVRSPTEPAPPHARASK
jgi:acyl carrier protein